LSKRSSLLLVTVVAAAITASLLLYTQLLSSQKTAIEHIVIIPSGSFIPPEDWKAGELVFNNRYYNPSNLTINVGDKVKWINRDSVTHTVTDLSEEALFDKILNPHEYYTVTFSRKGVYIYMCTIHPWQGGEIKVT